MINEQATIISNNKINEDLYKMVLDTNLASYARPGQFIQIQVPTCYLRRPISICEIKENTLTIIYKVVGKGTDILSSLESKTKLDIFGPLGNGFDVRNHKVTLIGGGVGVPPLLQLAKEYHKHNIDIDIVLGFTSSKQVILEEEFKKISKNVYVCTDDGSYGQHGNVIKTIQDNNLDVEYVQACGPMGMLKAISKTYPKGQISLESRMACGLGACNGCVMKSVDGSVRVCKDGPVFEIGRVILW